MTVAANTVECLKSFIGGEVVAVLTNVFPLGRRDLAQGVKTLVFKDGRALSFSSNGGYWAEDPDEIRRYAIGVKKDLEAGMGQQLIIAGLCESGGRQ